MNGRQAGAANGCLLTLLLLALPLGYGNWVAYRQWSTARILSREGQTVQAEVVEVSAATGRGNYRVTYRLPAYLNPGGETRDARVGEQAYREASRAERIDVQILPAHPEVQRVVGAESPTLLIFFIGFFDILLLIALAIFILGA